MGKSSDEMKKIKSELSNILLNPPYSEYINLVHVSTIAFLKLRNVPLKAGESLSDYCVHVCLKEQPPQNFKLIDEYKGVRVFYEIIGVIRPLKE